jgi:hypothetical protein
MDSAWCSAGVPGAAGDACTAVMAACEVWCAVMGCYFILKDTMQVESFSCRNGLPSKQKLSLRCHSTGTGYSCEEGAKLKTVHSVHHHYDGSGQVLCWTNTTNTRACWLAVHPHVLACHADQVQGKLPTVLSAQLLEKQPCMVEPLTCL